MQLWGGGGHPELGPIEPALPPCCQTRALTMCYKGTSQCPPPSRPQRPHMWAHLPHAWAQLPCTPFTPAIFGPQAVSISSLTPLTITLTSDQTYMTHDGQMDIACIPSDALKTQDCLCGVPSIYAHQNLVTKTHQTNPKNTSGKQPT